MFDLWNFPSHYGEKPDFGVFFFFNIIFNKLHCSSKKPAGLITSPQPTDSY